MPELAERKSGHQPNFSWDEKLLHGHVVHWGEVFNDAFLAVFPFIWTRTSFRIRLIPVLFIIQNTQYKNTFHHFYPQLITYAVVLFKIDGELGDHDRVLHVHLDPLQALDALLASVSEIFGSKPLNLSQC